VQSKIRRYQFNVMMTKTTRLCSTKSILTVNGKFPGPTIYAREDDTLHVRVINSSPYNISIHWHGIRQLRTGWADGPAYITQCPIRPGHSYVYNFTIAGQRGTLLWHAHISWLRATVHGGLVVLPKAGAPYPFTKPDHERVVVLGEWWKSDTEAVVNQATTSGLAPNISDAHTINGQPGLRSNCASSGGFTLGVSPGKRYMLRLINAALNDELFFKIAGHEMTVVEVDAVYVKPFTTHTVLLTPGQTTNVIISATQGSGKYMVAVSPFMDNPSLAVDNITATATLQYYGTLTDSPTAPARPPSQNATTIAEAFASSLRSLNSARFPALVPLKVDHSLLFTVGLGINPCATCRAGNGSRVVASVNNVTFAMPTTSILQAHYYKIAGVFTADFPGKPLNPFNYTGAYKGNMATVTGTKVYKLAYNSTVQVVLQGTGIIAPESHPFHLHGFNFFAVGSGKGNFNPNLDPARFNLVDPVERNTVAVPNGGWVAIRFRADNPGVWFMHCHLEVHTTWGLKMVFLVENGNGPNQSVQPPPKDLPTC
ncbi:hypothetical protein M569_09159, partial [Genlisea aurea]